MAGSGGWTPTNACGLTASGLLRAVRPFVRSARPPWAEDAPVEARDAYLALLLDRAYYETAIAEITGIAASLDQVDDALRGELLWKGCHGGAHGSQVRGTGRRSL